MPLDQHRAIRKSGAKEFFHAINLVGFFCGRKILSEHRVVFGMQAQPPLSQFECLSHPIFSREIVEEHIRLALKQLEINHRARLAAINGN